MKKKAALTILGISFLIYGIIFAVDHLADAAISPTPEITPDAATIEKAKNDFLSNICASHGGVNCSIIRPDAAIICNDGTRDESTIIYAVPQCQNAVLSTVEQESDFMARSGCSPPPEMGCFTAQSYMAITQHMILKLIFVRAMPDTLCQGASAKKQIKSADPNMARIRWPKTATAIAGQDTN